MWLDLGDYRGPGHSHALVMYMVQRTKARNETLSYRVYVTDALQMIPQQKYLQRRWHSLIQPHKEIDSQAIIEHVIDRIEADDEPT